MGGGPCSSICFFSASCYDGLGGVGVGDMGWWVLGGWSGCGRLSGVVGVSGAWGAVRGGDLRWPIFLYEEGRPSKTPFWAHF